VGTASAVALAGATPVFADVDPSTFCLDVDSTAAAIGPQTAAVVAVHLYGHPADLPGLRALCDQRGLLLVEDAAQAHGTILNGSMIGGTGTAAFSFHATKNMTTGGEGGMLCVADAAVADRARVLRDRGLATYDGRVAIYGNQRMTELGAAIGRQQLARLPARNDARAKNASRYTAGLNHVITPRCAVGATHSWHQYTVRVCNGRRNDLLRALANASIEARVYYPTPIHRHEVFATCRRVELDHTDRAATEVLSLPVHASLRADEIDRIITVTNGSW